MLLRSSSEQHQYNQLTSVYSVGFNVVQTQSLERSQVQKLKSLREKEEFCLNTAASIPAYVSSLSAYFTDFGSQINELHTVGSVSLDNSHTHPYKPF